MDTSANLTNHFLIAMPQLADPNFSHTVTYICEHNDEGALGIVINRPLDINLSEILQHMDLDTDFPEVATKTIYFGGPVQQERGFVLHRPLANWESTLKITNDLGITTSRDILNAIAGNSGPEKSLIALGYAGWGAGQLEKEMAENAWLSGPADPNILFSTPDEKRWHAAAALLGIDVNLMSNETGHA